MPVALGWIIPEHVLLARYYDAVVVEDIHQQYVTGKALCEAVPSQQVHMIVDIMQVTQFPVSINAYRGAYGEKAANAGWVLIVGHNRLIGLISSVISNLMELRIAFLHSTDEALHYLGQRDLAVMNALAAAAPRPDDAPDASAAAR